MLPAQLLCHRHVLAIRTRTLELVEIVPYILGTSTITEGFARFDGPHSGLTFNAYFRQSATLSRRTWIDDAGNPIALLLRKVFHFLGSCPSSR
jgi:hypothetical protein